MYVVILVFDCVLVDNGMTLYLWLGHAVNPRWVQNVFGVQSAAQIDIDKVRSINRKFNINCFRCVLAY